MEKIIVAVIVGICAVFVIRNIVKSFAKKDACCGCSDAACGERQTNRENGK